MGNEFTSIKVTSTDKKGGDMKVAFATTDMEWIDAHFGKSGQFAIYEVSKDGYEMSELLKINDEELTGSKDKNDQIAEIISDKDVKILYIASIGPTAAAKVVKNRIHPMKITDDTKICDACDRLVTMLQGTPPPWIRRIIEKENA